MQRKQSTTVQRSLFAEWPTWQQLPIEARQHVEQLLANMCLEVIESNNSQEQFDARSHDKDSSS
jgi:hypothetical protein